MMHLNLIVWGLSMALQCVLLITLLARGIGRVTPVFAVLIAFYNIRSLAMFVVSNHHPGPSYPLMVGGLAFADVILQTIVAWELFSAAVRSPKLFSRFREDAHSNDPLVGSQLPLLRRIGLFALLATAATVSSYLIARYIHTNPHAPFDRSVLFNAALFLSVFLVTLGRNPTILIRRLMSGFALFSGASIVCQIGRAEAGWHRDAILFSRASYVEAAAYLVVIVLWILVLPRNLPTTTLHATQQAPA